jgi:hypothetical protein
MQMKIEELRNKYIKELIETFVNVQPMHKDVKLVEAVKYLLTHNWVVIFYERKEKGRV